MKSPTMDVRKRFALIDVDADTVEERDVDLAEFFVANDISPAEANAIGALAVGGEWMFGGGAAPTFALRREE